MHSIDLGRRVSVWQGTLLRISSTIARVWSAIVQMRDADQELSPLIAVGLMLPGYPRSINTNCLMVEPCADIRVECRAN
ncbi:hypothetical protein TNCV_119391 [Trichonephila clavipes]|nr:hypothetical protein TNCV_119391 [Trichonephila clavipes]